MRILHVTSSFPREEGEPTGVFVADVAALGPPARVLAPHAAGIPVDGEIGGVPVHRFRYAPARWEVLAYRGGLMAAVRSPAGAAVTVPYLAAMAAATRRAVRSWQPDGVHAHWWFPGGVAAMLSGAPYVVTLHGSDVELLSRPGLRRLGRRVAGRARGVVAVSAALAAKAQPLLGVDVGVAPMPVSVPPAQPAPGGLPRVVLAVGRLTPEKGFDVLVDAARHAGPLRLVMIGDGPLAASLRARAQGLDVEWRGTRPRGGVHAAMAAADVVVVPSRREGLGLVAVEAILSGRPVIASCTGGLPAVLGAVDAPPLDAGAYMAVDGGALVAPGDAAGLAAALRVVLPPPGGRALQAAAAHAPDRVAAAYNNLYEAAFT